MRGSLAGTSSSSSRSCGQSSKLESTHWWPHFAYAIRPNGVSPARPERRCSCRWACSCSSKPNCVRNASEGSPLTQRQGASSRGMQFRPRCRVILGRAPDLHRKKHSTMQTRGTNTMAGRVANVTRMPAGGYGFSLVGTDQAGGWRVRSINVSRGWRPRLRSLDHRTHALGVKRLPALVEVASVLQSVADLPEAEALSRLGTCPR